MRNCYEKFSSPNQMFGSNKMMILRLKNILRSIEKLFLRRLATSPLWIGFGQTLQIEEEIGSELLLNLQILN